MIYCAIQTQTYDLFSNNLFIEEIFIVFHKFLCSSLDWDMSSQQSVFHIGLNLDIYIADFKMFQSFGLRLELRIHCLQILS